MEKTTISGEDLKDFLRSDMFVNIVQKNKVKYRYKWWSNWAEKEGNISLRTKASWNWSAFLLGFYWLLYRKMYRELSILLVLNIFSNLITMGLFFLHASAIMTNSVYMLYTFLAINALFGFLIMFIIGIYGNVWYLRKCVRIADTASRKFNNPNADVKNHVDDSASVGVIQRTDKTRFLREIGGTNSKAVLAYLVGYTSISAFGYEDFADPNILILYTLFDIVILVCIYYAILKKNMNSIR